MLIFDQFRAPFGGRGSRQGNPRRDGTNRCADV